jgi:hypothetical protein
MGDGEQAPIEPQKSLTQETLPGFIQSVPSSQDLTKNPSRERERGANWVAKGLVIIFAGTIASCLIGGFVIISRHPPPSAGAGPGENIVGQAVLPFLQGVGTFASTVFGPLLAFVLGYYFGEKRQG